MILKDLRDRFRAAMGNRGAMRPTGPGTFSQSVLSASPIRQRKHKSETDLKSKTKTKQHTIQSRIYAHVK